MPQSNRNHLSGDSPIPGGEYDRDYGREQQGHPGDRPRSSGGYSGSYYGSDGYGSEVDYSASGSAPLSYRGRGPKGYVRSDERLREMICERLTDDPDIDASDVSIEVKNQVVKLSGSVNNRRSKYEIEELIEYIGGVQDIDNQLRLQSSQLRHGAPTGAPPATAASKRN